MSTETAFPVLYGRRIKNTGDLKDALSRPRKHVRHGNNYGKYTLLNVRTCFVVLGEKFDATLEDIESFSKRHRRQGAA